MELDGSSFAGVRQVESKAAVGVCVDSWGEKDSSSIWVQGRSDEGHGVGYRLTENGWQSVGA